MDQIGSGSFGVVMKCQNRLDGLLYAIKRTKEPINGRKKQELLLREVRSLASMDICPNIVRYYSAWMEEGYLYIQQELCENTLQGYVGTPMKEKYLRVILRQLLLGLEHIHSRGLVHLDIKVSTCRRLTSCRP